jgi:hypothetical protein
MNARYRLGRSASGREIRCREVPPSALPSPGLALGMTLGLGVPGGDRIDARPRPRAVGGSAIRTNRGVVL